MSLSQFYSVSLSVESMVKLIDCLLKLFDGSLLKLLVTKATPPDKQLLLLKVEITSNSASYTCSTQNIFR